MSFKHNILFHAVNEDQKTTYLAKLESIGYKLYSGNTIKPYDSYIKSYGHQKEYSIFDSANYADFETLLFDGLEEWQCHAALATASILEGEEYHENEWVVLDKIVNITGQSNNYTIGNIYQLGGSYYKNYPGKFMTVGDDKDRPNGSPEYKFHKATPEEIIEFFKNKYTATKSTDATSSGYTKATVKKIIGYRLIKNGPGFKKGLELLVPINLEGERKGYASKVRENRQETIIRFPNEILADIEWFEPIYEKVVKEEKLTLGTKGDNFTVREDGTINCERIGDFNVSAVQDIINYYGGNNGASVIGYTTSIKTDWRSILVGCANEDHRFSLDELNQLVSAYKRLKNN